MPGVYIGGVRGVGKTEICGALAEKYGVPVFTSSEILRKAAKVSTKEELDGLSEEIKDHLRATAFLGIYQRFTNFIREGHFLLTDNDAPYLFLMIVLEADPNKILEYRKSDRERKRSLEVEAILEEAREVRCRALNFSRKHGIPLYFVENNHKISKVVSKIEAILSQSGVLVPAEKK